MIVRDVLSIIKNDNSIVNQTNEMVLTDLNTPAKKLSELGGLGVSFARFQCNEDVVKGQFINLLSTGKIETIGTKIITEQIPMSASTNFYYQNPSSGGLSVSFDPFVQNRVAIAYTGYVQSQYTYIAVIIGTILDDGTIKFGKENILSAEVYDGGAKGIFDPLVQNRYFLVYNKQQSSLGFTRACSILGDTVTAGPVIQFSTTFADSPVLIADPFQKGRYAIGYRDGNAFGVVCGVSCGSSGITVTSTTNFYTSASISYRHLCFDKLVAGKLIIIYSRNNIVYSIVGTFTGETTTITYGAENTVTNRSSVQAVMVSFFASNTVLLAYSIANTAIYYKLGSISANTITMGSELTLTLTASTATGIYGLSNSNLPNKLIVYYSLGSNNYIIVGTISGGAISFGSPTQVSTGSKFNMEQDPFFVGRFISAVADGTNGVAKAVQLGVTTSNLKPNYYIGVSTTAATTGSFCMVQIAGLCSELSGLTPGSTYYIQSNGTIGLTVSSVKAGIAFAANKLLLTT